MITKQENEWSEPYLRTNLSAKDHERLAAELRADPHLLGKLLQLKTPQDEEQSAALLFGDPNVPNQDVLDGNIRKYLLRDPNFTEEEIGELEELMLEDERYFERMMLVESELIEDYSRRTLSADEEKRFNNSFLVTPERREKLAYIEAVTLTYVEEKAKGVAATAAESKKAEQSQTASASWWDSFLAFWHSQNLFAGVAAASVLLFVAVGALWLTSRQTEQSALITTAPTNEPAQNINDSNNLNQSEIARQTGNVAPSTATPQMTNAVSPQPAKSPQSNQGQKKNENPAPPPVVKPAVNAPRSVVFALIAGVSRGGGNAAEQKIEPGAKLVQLRLQLDTERKYDDFRLVVQDSDGKEVGRSERLKATKKGDSLTTALPAASFKPDDYTVILSGGTKGVYEEAARYSFRVLK